MDTASCRLMDPFSLAFFMNSWMAPSSGIC